MPQECPSNRLLRASTHVPHVRMQYPHKGADVDRLAYPLTGFRQWIVASPRVARKPAAIAIERVSSVARRLGAACVNVSQRAAARHGLRLRHAVKAKLEARQRRVPRRCRSRSQP